MDEIIFLKWLKAICMLCSIFVWIIVNQSIKFFLSDHFPLVNWQCLSDMHCLHLTIETEDRSITFVRLVFKYLIRFRVLWKYRPSIWVCLIYRTTNIVYFYFLYRYLYLKLPITLHISKYDYISKVFDIQCLHLQTKSLNYKR